MAACQNAQDVAADAGWDAEDGDAGWEQFRPDEGDSGGEDDLPPNPACARWEGMSGEAIKDDIRAVAEGHYALSYEQAREEIFTRLDNQGGWVECVYTGQRVQTAGIPDVSIMNVEHTWPQSWGSDTLPAKSDLNHLFPVMAGANTMRSAHPFGEVLEPSWEEGGSKLGLDGWGDVVFEPRNQHKGDAARAVFYFAASYRMEIFSHMESVLRRWNAADPPDEKEKARADSIGAIQMRRNPFVDCPELVERVPDF